MVVAKSSNALISGNWKILTFLNIENMSMLEGWPECIWPLGRKKVVACQFYCCIAYCIHSVRKVICRYKLILLGIIYNPLITLSFAWINVWSLIYFNLSVWRWCLFANGWTTWNNSGDSQSYQVKHVNCCWSKDAYVHLLTFSCYQRKATKGGKVFSKKQPPKMVLKLGSSLYTCSI